MPTIKKNVHIHGLERSMTQQFNVSIVYRNKEWWLEGELDGVQEAPVHRLGPIRDGSWHIANVVNLGPVEGTLAVYATESLKRAGADGVSRVALRIMMSVRIALPPGSMFIQMVLVDEVVVVFAYSGGTDGDALFTAGNGWVGSG
jgi:hypothetical protein